MAVGQGFHIADAYVEIHADKEPLEREVEGLGRGSTGSKGERGGTELGKRVGKGLGDESGRQGKQSGDKLAQGMNLALIRNSPMIAAAVGGALAFGAPAVLAGAGLLFGGLAVVAAAQNDKVKASFTGLATHIKQGMDADAQAVVPVVSAISGKLAGAFDALQPKLKTTFVDSVPIIDRFSTALVKSGTSMMDGLLTAVQRSGPAMDGFDKLLESVGTGVGDMFANLSTHSAASGTALASLGSIVQSLLSIMTTFMGQGVELASVILPPLASVLKLVADAAGRLGPILPVVAAGFTAWKIASTVSGFVETLATKLETAAVSSGRFAGAAGTVSSGLSKLASGIGVVAATAGLLMAAWSAGERQADEWATALLAGGKAAEDASAQMAHADERSIGAMSDLGAWWSDFQAVLEGYANAQDKATAKSRQMLDAMDPLTRAQTLQTQAQNDMNKAVEDYGPNSQQAIAAAGRYADASRDVKRIQDEEAVAIRGVTDAMIAQAGQADSRANSDVAYRQAVLNSTQAIKDYRDTVKSAKPGSDALKQSTLDVESALIRQAEAAGKLAQDSMPASMDANQKAAEAAKASLSEFDRLAKEFGGPLPENLQRYRDELARAAGQMDLSSVNASALAAGLGEVGLAVVNVPDSKSVEIKIPTQPQIDALTRLGFTVTTLPNGNVLVSAQTDAAQRNIGDVAQALAQVGQLNPTPTVGPLKDNITPQVPTIIGQLYDLGAEHPVPRTELDTRQFDASMGVTHDSLMDLGSQRPTPTVDLNKAPLDAKTGQVRDALTGIAIQRPTPTADLASGPFRSVADALNGVLSRLNATRVFPQANLIANTYAAESAINYAARQRTVAIYGVFHGTTTTMGMQADGGFVGEPKKVVKRSGGGTVKGPGTTTSDSVPFLSSAGSTWLSDQEYVVKARSTLKYGRTKMDAVNAGTATITTRSDAPAASAPGSGGGTSIGELHMHFDGTWDLTNPQQLRGVARKVRQAIIDLEREAR